MEPGSTKVAEAHSTPYGSSVHSFPPPGRGSADEAKPFISQNRTWASGRTVKAATSARWAPLTRFPPDVSAPPKLMVMIQDARVGDVARMLRVGGCRTSIADITPIALDLGSCDASLAVIETKTANTGGGFADNAGNVPPAVDVCGCTVGIADAAPIAVDVGGCIANVTDIESIAADASGGLAGKEPLAAEAGDLAAGIAGIAPLPVGVGEGRATLAGTMLIAVGTVGCMASTAGNMPIAPDADGCKAYIAGIMATKKKYTKIGTPNLPPQNDPRRSGRSWLSVGRVKVLGPLARGAPRLSRRAPTHASLIVIPIMAMKSEASTNRLRAQRPAGATGKWWISRAKDRHPISVRREQLRDSH